MEMTEVTEVTFQPLLVSIPRAAEMIGRGQTFIYECLGNGTLKGVKSDARTLVVFDSLREYVASLPLAKIKPVTIPLPQRMRRKNAIA